MISLICRIKNQKTKLDLETKRKLVAGGRGGGGGGVGVRRGVEGWVRKVKGNIANNSVITL